jgi:hypothetical protein
MSETIEVKYEDTPFNGPWGQTIVRAEHSQYDFSQLVMQGHADVTTNENGVLLVQRGAACITTIRIFHRKQVVFHPIPPQTGLLGVLLLEREGKKTHEFRAKPCETLTLTIEPDAIVVEADTGGSIRELHRTQLIGIAALQTEAVLSFKPRTRCSTCTGRDPATVRLLMPNAVAS